MDIVVLDTNVLITDPDALMAYPGKEVVLPEVVFSELDKLKISRSDPETRYKGRELTRKLFELSHGKSLTDGVNLENGSILRIVPFNTDLPLPEGFSAKNPDDRIIVTAQRLTRQERESDVILITNDLNMLLKAQQLGVHIERHDGGDERGFLKRYVVRPFQKYRTPLLILAIAVAIFAATVVVAVNTNARNSDYSLPSEYRNFLTEEQANAIDALVKLQSNPSDSGSLLTVANLYYEYYEAAAAQNSSDAMTYAKRGISYFGRYLEVCPDDTEAHVELALLDLYAGDVTGANQTLDTALGNDPESINANYTKGVVAMQGDHDYTTAASYFEKAIELCGDDEANSSTKQSAQNYLQQVQSETDSLSNPDSGGAAA